MVSHGFGTPRVMSGTIDLKEITEITRQISLVKPIIRAHLVQRIVCGEKVGYEIIFEYGHLAKHDMTPAHLLKELKAAVRVGDHKIANSTEFLVIQKSYQNGKPIEYEPK